MLVVGMDQTSWGFFADCVVSPQGQNTSPPPSFFQERTSISEGSHCLWIKTLSIGFLLSTGSSVLCSCSWVECACVCARCVCLQRLDLCSGSTLAFYTSFVEWQHVWRGWQPVKQFFWSSSSSQPHSLPRSGDITEINVLARKTAEGIDCLPKMCSMKPSWLLRLASLISYCVCSLWAQGFPCGALRHCVLHPQDTAFSFDKLLSSGFKLVKHLRLYLYCYGGNIEHEIY